MSLFEIIYIIGLVVGSTVRILYTRHYRKNIITLNRKTGLDILLTNLAGLGFILPLLYLFSPWLDFASYRLPKGTGWLGAVLFAAAIGLLWKSHIDLGHNWSPSMEIRKGHTLAASGVYRFIRHPMYAAHWLWGIAQILLLPNWIAGPSLLVFFTLHYWQRVSGEEKMMLEQFGRQYGEYKKQTGRIFPKHRT